MHLMWWEDFCNRQLQTSVDCIKRLFNSFTVVAKKWTEAELSFLTQLTYVTSGNLFDYYPINGEG